MHFTRAAVEEGIVPGGGVALLRSVSVLEKLKAEGDELTGINIVKRSLEEAASPNRPERGGTRERLSIAASATPRTTTSASTPKRANMAT